ncbi:MAG: hypothetical protein ABL958_10110, partial [Bdellovibrionia bacterium]
MFEFRWAATSYKELCDSVSDDDMNALIKVFDRHVNHGDKGNRLDLMLDLAHRARTKGILKQLYRGLENIASSGSVQEASELFGKIYSLFQKDPDYKQDVRVLRGLAKDVIDMKVSDQAVTGLARGFNGSNGQALAFFMSRTSSRFPLASGEIVDEIAKVAKALIEDRSLRTLQILAADPAVHQAFAGLSTPELGEIEKLFVRISSGASRGDLKILEGLKKLTVKTDRQMRCWDDGTNVRSFQNLFDVAADEQARRRRDYNRINRFWVVELPVMISASLGKCDLDRTITDELEITSDLAKRGLATGLAMSLLGFYDKGRGTYIKNVLKSQHAVEAGGLIENLAIRQGTTYAIELLTKSIKPADFQALGRIFTASVLDDLRGAELDAWLVSHFREPSLTELRAHVNGLPAHLRSLLNLLGRLEVNGPSDLSMRIRVSLSDEPAVSPAEKATFNVFEHALADAVRPNLKKTAEAFVRSWGLTNEGWGAVFEHFAQAVALSQERPYQEALSEFLANEDDYETVINFMVRYSNHPKFHEAVRFTGKIAGEGNLDRLVSFLIDFFRATGKPGLNPPPNTPGYTPSNEKANLAELENRKIPDPSPAPGDFSSCSRVTGDLFEPTGETMFNA